MARPPWHHGRRMVPHDSGALKNELLAHWTHHFETLEPYPWGETLLMELMMTWEAHYLRG